MKRAPKTQAERIWVEYLAHRGHEVEEQDGFLLSRNNTRRRFFWLLYSSARARRTFRKAELSGIRKLLSRCERKRGKAYVVVCFTWPEPKFVAASAEYVLKEKELHADKGGVFL